MKSLVAFLALLLAAGLARADLVVVQSLKQGDQTTPMTIKLSGDNVRVDMDSEVSAIVDAATGDTTVIMHAQKSYMLISGSTTQTMVKQMLSMLQQSGSGAAAASQPLKATGQTQKINGYNAAEYTYSSPMFKATYWMSTDFPNAKAVNAALEQVRRESSALDPTSQLAPDLSGLPGVPVRTEETLVGSGQSAQSDLVSATFENVDPGVFKIPAGYTEVKMPTAGDAGSAQDDSQVPPEVAAKLKNPLDLHFTAVDGTQVDISKMRGKVVLVDFWATWCGPCCEEAPNVVSAYKKLHDKGFEVIGISLDQDKDALLTFTRQNGMVWPQFFDGKGWDNSISSSYGIEAIPAMWLVNKKGYVVSTDAEDGLEDQVQKLLAE